MFTMVCVSVLCLWLSQLVRRCLASSFVLLKKYSWRQSLVVQFMEVLHTCTLTGHADSIPDGLKFHIVDIFFEELEKVAAGSVSHISLIQ